MVMGLGAGLALFCATGSAQEQWSSAERAQIFAALPNWSGLWESKVSAASDNLTGYPAAKRTDSIVTFIPLLGKPPYKPGWERKHPPRGKATAPGLDSTKLCRDLPFPILLELPFMFQVFVTPEETLFLYEDGDVRHVYTDGRKHPSKEDLWPTSRGNSIGHWEGATLVIDTIEVKPGGSPDLSNQAHFTERVRRVDRNTMEDDLTIDDPVRFAHPWHVSTQWSRVLDQDRMLPFDCENDRNPIVNDKITIAPPR
jgi:hypothetical protein